MNKTLIDFIHNTNRIYSQNDCNYLCSNLFALENSLCKCNSNLADFATNCHRQAYEVEETEIKKCISEYLQSFRKTSQIDKCINFCPEQCDSMSYSISNYVEQFPVSGKISENNKIDYGLSKFNNYEEVNKNFAIIYVYYKNLKYTIISQDPKTETFNLVSSIGGTLGLFLGVSFLSFIEIFEILFEIIFILFFNKI